MNLTKLFSKIVLILILIPSFSYPMDTKKHEKSKTISKNFSVNSNATVYIDNKYGNVNVTTWEKNTVEIEVVITVKGSNKSKVEDKLNAIRIDFEGNSSLVEARTVIESTRSGWSWWGNNNNINYKINYFIKMPATNNADFNNKYGNIILDVLKGKANINCDYGSVQVDQLLNSSNSIELDYCSNSEIHYMKSGDVNVDYSKITIDEAEDLRVNADYTGVKIGKVRDIEFNSDYGSISIKDLNTVDGNSDYARMKLGTVRKSAKISTDYGGVEIKNLAVGFDKVIIDGNYAGIKIGTSSENNFNFTVDLSYASFNYPDDYVETFKSIKKTSKKYYEGSFGKQKTKSKIKINSDYGSFSLRLND